jgi:hypothetical protein
MVIEKREIESVCSEGTRGSVEEDNLWDERNFDNLVRLVYRGDRGQASCNISELFSSR